MYFIFYTWYQQIYIERTFSSLSLEYYAMQKFQCNSLPGFIYNSWSQFIKLELDSSFALYLVSIVKPYHIHRDLICCSSTSHMSIKYISEDQSLALQTSVQTEHLLVFKFHLFWFKVLRLDPEILGVQVSFSQNFRCYFSLTVWSFHNIIIY